MPRDHAMLDRVVSCLYRSGGLARQILALVGLAMIARGPPAMADGLRTMAGAGTSLCSAFLQEYEQDPQTTAWIYLSWAQGYLSAVNLRRTQLGELAVDMLPSDFNLTRQTAFLHAYCRSWPGRSFDQAATEMYRDLRAHHPLAADSLPVP